MKTKRFGLTMCLLTGATSLWAGEPVLLDKNFSFRLTQPELQQAPPAPAPVLPAPPARPERRLDGPLKTPEGDILPPGSRPFQFNGQTYYLIPL